MTWEAVDAVDDALDATRRFLFPFSVVRWAKLALLVVFMGAGVNTSVSVPPVPNVETDTLTAGELAAAGAELGIGHAGLVALAIGIVAISVLFAVVSLSLRLVFYDALRTTEVRLWQPVTRRFRQAAGLFGFSLVVGLVLGGPFAIAAIASERGLLSFDALSALEMAVAVTAAVGILVLGLLVLRVTYEFVVPVMVLENRGVVAGWRRFYPTLRTAWTSFVVYLVIHVFLALAISIAETVVLLFVGGIALVLAALVLVVVAGVLGGLGALTGTTAGIAATAAVVLFAVVAIIIVLLPVRILTRTYLIAYEVSTLGNIDPQLALLEADADADGGDDGDDDDDVDGKRTSVQERDTGRSDANDGAINSARTTDSTGVTESDESADRLSGDSHSDGNADSHRDHNDDSHRDGNADSHRDHNDDSHRDGNDETTDEPTGDSTNDRG